MLVQRRDVVIFHRDQILRQKFKTILVTCTKHAHVAVCRNRVVFENHRTIGLESFHVWFTENIPAGADALGGFGPFGILPRARRQVHRRSDFGDFPRDIFSARHRAYEQHFLPDEACVIGNPVLVTVHSFPRPRLRTVEFRHSWLVVVPVRDDYGVEHFPPRLIVFSALPHHFPSARPPRLLFRALPHRAHHRRHPRVVLHESFEPKRLRVPLQIPSHLLASAKPSHIATALARRVERKFSKSHHLSRQIRSQRRVHRRRRL
mmetsp:Transcript_3903/g.15066  ORF Transcript_3903/g.15066 Transcript_3903/m.15066 type:complete len:262 (+) Transcript_3903:3121-3906(+)